MAGSKGPWPGRESAGILKSVTDLGLVALNVWPLGNRRRLGKSRKTGLEAGCRVS